MSSCIRRSELFEGGTRGVTRGLGMECENETGLPLYAVGEVVTGFGAVCGRTTEAFIFGFSVRRFTTRF